MSRPRPWTPFPDLDDVLADLVAGVAAVLATDLVGIYLVGSFAAGGGDEHSDVDFLVVTRDALTTGQEEQLRALHAAFPDSPVLWARHLEGSYVPVARLRHLDVEATPWLYVDNGSREMQWTPHDNTAVFRRSLREHGVALQGPPVSTLVAAVDDGALRREARTALTTLVDGLDAWAGLDNAWAQPHVVTTLCRMLATVLDGVVLSKTDALDRARRTMDDRWSALISDAVSDRPDPWARVHLSARSGSVQTTLSFARAVRSRALEDS